MDSSPLSFSYLPNAIEFPPEIFLMDVDHALLYAWVFFRNFLYTLHSVPLVSKSHHIVNRAICLIGNNRSSLTLVLNFSFFMPVWNRKVIEYFIAFWLEICWCTYDVCEKGYEGILEAMRKARRLNNHVFSMLRARCPLEDKVACAIKPSGAPLHRMKFMNTVSAFETLPQRATWRASRQMCSCMWVLWYVVVSYL